MATPTDTITLNGDDRSAQREIVETGRGHIDIDQAVAAFNEL